MNALVTDLTELPRLFHYNAWANARLVDALRPASDRALAIAAHGFTAERIWLMRLRGETTDGDSIWPELSVRACASLAARNASALAAYIEGLDKPDLTRKVRYRNSKGVAYATAAGDVLRHLLLHSAYHRGQAAAALREDGAEPPVTDFIVFVRERHEAHPSTSSEGQSAPSTPRVP
ncbi:MAG: DinB family protein [Rhodothermales bacterium]